MSDDTTQSDPNPSDVPELPVTDESGGWVPPRGPGITDPTTIAGTPTGTGRKTLDEWIKEWDWRRGKVHPYVHEIKAIPMGGDRVPMNHDMDTLTAIAIHLDRRGAVFPAADYDAPGVVEIHYQDPEHGPAIVTNPGEWIDIDTPVKERTAPGTGGTPISLAGVPQDQLDLLKRAIQDEEARKLTAEQADPAAREEALRQLAAEPTMTVALTPADMPAVPVPETVIEETEESGDQP